MAIPDWILRHLDDWGVPYHTHHRRSAYSAEAVTRREHVSGAQFGKVVVALVDGKPTLLVMPGCESVDPDRARFALSAGEVRLAREEEIGRLLPDARVGATPPLRHWAGVEIWIDPSLKHEGEFVFQAGTHEEVVHMSFADWLILARPKIAHFVRSHN